MSFKICNSIDGASTFHIFNNMHHFLRLRVNALIQHILLSMRQSIEHKKIEKLNLSFFAVFLNKINLMNIFLMNLIIKVLIVIQFQKGQINFMFLLAKETGSIGHQCNMVKN